MQDLLKAAVIEKGFEWTAKKLIRELRKESQFECCRRCDPVHCIPCRLLAAEEEESVWQRLQKCGFPEQVFNWPGVPAQQQAEESWCKQFHEKYLTETTGTQFEHKQKFQY